ncbi:MAG: nucleotide exchange factor GrpE [bacterium]
MSKKPKKHDAPGRHPAGSAHGAPASPRAPAGAGTREPGAASAGPSGETVSPGATASAETGAPAEPSVSSLEARVRELERELDASRAEAQAAADRALRTLAEFDNYRRRTDRERDEVIGRGRADVLRELLEVCDNFDRALDHAGDGVSPSFLEGMKLVARGLHDLLDRKGVARIEAEGQPFDPEQHEALTMMPKDGAEPDTVIQVVQAGYRLGDRVLRPAKVIVAAPMPARVEAPSDADAVEPAEDA